MSNQYRLNTMSDLLKIPMESIDRFLEDLRLLMEAAHFVGGEDIAAANFDNMVWTDDGEHTVKMNLVEVREEDCPADSPQEASDA